MIALHSIASKCKQCSYEIVTHNIIIGNNGNDD
jgi:hypothetical protein